MFKMIWLPTLACALVLFSVARSADLAKIDRTLAKEPNYQSKAPQYVLLVFGPEAKTRVWLVLDGDVLYVDRNGDGNLADEGERRKATVNKDSTGETLSFDVGDLVDVTGKVKYHIRSVSARYCPDERKWRLGGFNPFVSGKFAQGTAGGFFADRPQDAPVLHLDGPLTMGLHRDAVLARGRDELIDAWIGTPNPGKGRPTLVDFEDYRSRFGHDLRGVPPDVHPVAEVEFPNRDPNGKPIRVTVLLKSRF